jgi:esterase/lipase superfamily enzyme
VKEEYKRWYTSHLSRDFELLVFGHAGYPVILFPTSKGRYYECKDVKFLDSVAHLLDQGLIKIYAPDGVDGESWYNTGINPADRVRTHNAYENVIVHDVIPIAQHECGSPKVAVSGASLGGFHAANLAFRHPHLVGHLVSMSGTFDIKQFITGYYDDNCYFNNPPDYMANLGESDYLNLIRNIDIVLGVGDADSCLDENRHMSAILNAKSIPHQLDVRSGDHDWPLWRDMFPHYLWALLQKEGRVH